MVKAPVGGRELVFLAFVDFGIGFALPTPAPLGNPTHSRQLLDAGGETPHVPPHNGFRLGFAPGFRETVQGAWRPPSFFNLPAGSSRTRMVRVQLAEKPSEPRKLEETPIDSNPAAVRGGGRETTNQH